MSKKNIAVFIGSASKTSFNHLAVKHLQKIAPETLALNIVEIADLPLYDRDLNNQNVPEYTRMREALHQADGVLWVTPEHNGSYSAMLKNAIDVGSVSGDLSGWSGKPLGIVSVSANGSPRPADHLRVIAAGLYVNMPTLPFAACVGGIFSGAFNEQGEIVSEQVKTTLQNFINAYAAFVERF